MRRASSLRVPVMLAVVAIAFSGIGLKVESSTASNSLQPHSPITIEGDEDFTFENGVRDGSGTRHDPFLIEGWEIAAHGQGITVRDTTAAFLLKNVAVRPDSPVPLTTGILLSNVSDGRIERSTITRVGYGIDLWDVRHIWLSNNNVSANAWGLIGFCTDCVIAGNLVTRNNVGVALYASNVTFYGNLVSQNVEGIGLNHPHGVVVEGNTISDNVFGLTLGGDYAAGNDGSLVAPLDADDARVFHNNLVNNQNQGFSDPMRNHTWDNGYPSGGNFWSDHPVTDWCSGVNQDVCTGSDGIVDAPYAIGHEYPGPSLNAIDRYPLARPYILPSFDPLALWPVVVLPPFLVAVAVGLLILARPIRLRRRS